MSWLFVKAEMGNSRIKWGGYEEWNENVGNQRGIAGNLGGNAENAQNQCGDAEDQSGKLGIAVEMT